MAIELGAKAGIFPVTEDSPDRTWLTVDEEAVYRRTLHVDLDQLQTSNRCPPTLSITSLICRTLKAETLMWFSWELVPTAGRKTWRKQLISFAGQQLSIRLIVNTRIETGTAAVHCRWLDAKIA